MAKPLISVRKGSGGAWMNASVYVDSSEVQHAIDAVLAAVSPAGLSSFMVQYVGPYLQDQIVDRFAEHGGGVIGGSWPPLEQSTEMIRHAMGYFDDEAINERTGELLHHLLTNEIIVSGLGAEIIVPENTSDTELQKKLRTAQMGHVQGPNEMLPGAITPPRPVLAIDATDLASVMIMLQTHIAMYASNQMFTIGSLP